MVAYLEEVKALLKKIKDFKLRQISREENRKVDALANLSLVFDFISDRNISLKFLLSCSINVAKPIYKAIVAPTWMDDTNAYLQDGTLPSDKLPACQIQYRFAKFCLLHGTLYKRYLSGQVPPT